MLMGYNLNVFHCKEGPRNHCSHSIRHNSLARHCYDRRVHRISVLEDRVQLKR